MDAVSRTPHFPQPATGLGLQGVPGVSLRVSVLSSRLCKPWFSKAWFEIPDQAEVKFEVKSDGVRVRFRVRFQAGKLPIFGGFPGENPTKKANGLKGSSKGNFFVQVRFGEVSSTVEEVVRVRFCCLLS